MGDTNRMLLHPLLEKRELHRMLREPLESMRLLRHCRRTLFAAYTPYAFICAPIAIFISIVRLALFMFPWYACAASILALSSQMLLNAIFSSSNV